MTDSIMYHDGNRRLQDRFDGRRIADRLEEKLTRTQFTPDDKTFIESAPFFFSRRQTARDGQIALTRAECPALFALPDLRSSHFLTMTVTAGSFRLMRFAWLAEQGQSFGHTRLADYVSDPAIVGADEDDDVIAVLYEKGMGTCLLHLVRHLGRQRVKFYVLRYWVPDRLRGVLPRLR